MKELLKKMSRCQPKIVFKCSENNIQIGSVTLTKFSVPFI